MPVLALSLLLLAGDPAAPPSRAPAPASASTSPAAAPATDPPPAPAPVIAPATPTPAEDESNGVRSPSGFHRRANDSTYGRIDGDVSLVFGAGVTFGPRSPRGAVDFRVRYLQSIGVYADYEDGFGDAAQPKRLFATGLELRPLFFGRWLQGFETGRSRWDLTLDSLGFTLGAVFSQPIGQTFASRPGLEAALGLEFPLTGRATGMWIDLRAGGRWSDAELGGTGGADAADRSLFCTLTLAWHQGFSAHVVDQGDRAPE